MKTIKRTVCDPNCHADPRCGIAATIQGDKIVSITAAQYPVDGFKDRICLMGRSRLDYQYHKDRLSTPLRRIGERGSGEFEPISWDEAIDLFTQQHRQMIDKFGPRSVAFSQGSGAYGLLTRGASHRYAALTGALTSKAGGVDYGLAKGLEYMFNVPASSYFQPGGNAINDVENSELTILWGSNMVVTRSVEHVALKRARRNGTKLICIDPTNSETASICDEWISIRPGSDGALAWGIAREIVSKQMFDEQFVKAYTDLPLLLNTETGTLLREKDILIGGGESALVWCSKNNKAMTYDNAASVDLQAAGVYSLEEKSLRYTTIWNIFTAEADSFTLGHTAKITGIPEQVIQKLAAEYAQTRPAAIRMGYGIDRYYHADSTARSIAALGALTGNIGSQGGGISISGGLKYPRVKGRLIYAPDGIVAESINMMDLDSRVKYGDTHPVKMVCNTLGNPFNQVKPDRGKVLEEYVSKLDFIVTIDHFMTETAKFSDLVLPACTIFEKDDLVVDTFLQLQQKMVEPKGDSKSDYDIFRMLGKRMGLEKYFDKSAKEFIQEIIESSNDSVMADVTWDQLHEKKVVYPWKDTTPYVGFRDKAFNTETGRIEFFKEKLAKYNSEIATYREPIEASPNNPLFKDFPLVLLSSHSRYRIHSTFANMPLVLKKEPEPIARINPIDARDRGIDAEHSIKVFNQRGYVIIKCKIDSGIRRGTLLISEGHWVDQFIEGDPYVLTHDQFNKTAENYAHYDVLVDMLPIE